MANPNGLNRCSCSDRSAAELLCGKGPHDEERTGVPDETASQASSVRDALFRTAQAFGRLFFLTGELIGSQLEFFKSSASARSQFSSASPPAVAQISYARSRMLSINLSSMTAPLWLFWLV